MKTDLSTFPEELTRYDKRYHRWKENFTKEVKELCQYYGDQTAREILKEILGQ